MRRGFLLLLFASNVLLSFAQAPRTVVYLIPGQGSDGRIFSRTTIDPQFDTVHIRYLVPEKNETMNSYARRLAVQIDTTRPFVLAGVSLGGMLATEMSTFLHPKKVILISSAVSRSELPSRYRFMRSLPLYRIFPSGLIKAGSYIAQPLVEPDRRKEKNTFRSMLHAKDRKFMKRSIHLIVRWSGPQEAKNCTIVHIHGSKDHTLPLRKVQADYVVEKGSHMMALTRAEEISVLINKILAE